LDRLGNDLKAAVHVSHSFVVPFVVADLIAMLGCAWCAFSPYVMLVGIVVMVATWASFGACKV
jgi:hypothetical protein